MPRAVKEPLVICHDAAAATAGGTVVDVSGCSAVVIQVTGSFTATVVPKVTVDESNYVTVEAVNLNDSSRTASITATGIYVVPVAGAALFKADMTWSAGTSITVKARGLYDGLAEALMPDVQASSALTSVVPGTGATNLGKAEDDAHTSGDVGVEMLAVRKDTAAGLAADGDYHVLEVDSTGRLYTNAGFVAGTATNTADNTVTNASETILAANSSRKAAVIQVVSGGNARVTIDGVDATTSLGTQLSAGGAPLVLTHPFCPTTAIKAIREGSTDAVISVLEIA